MYYSKNLPHHLNKNFRSFLIPIYAKIACFQCFHWNMAIIDSDSGDQEDGNKCSRLAVLREHDRVTLLWECEYWQQQRCSFGLTADCSCCITSVLLLQLWPACNRLNCWRRKHSWRTVAVLPSPRTQCTAGAVGRYLPCLPCQCWALAPDTIKLAKLMKAHPGDSEGPCITTEPNLPYQEGC